MGLSILTLYSLRHCFFVAHCLILLSPFPYIFIVYKKFFIVGAIFLINGNLSAQQTANNFQATVQLEVAYKYLLFLPENQENAIDGLSPMIVFLHGSGERGDKLDLVKKHGPPKLVEENKDFPFIVISPQCPSGERWDPIALEALITEMIHKHPVDPNRIYLTGLSMGGYGTWDLALRNPTMFAAIAPICGGDHMDAYQVYKIKDLPIWVFHGALDQAVPIGNSVTIVNALKKIDNRVKFTVYPEAGHDSWTETYNNPELYQWFLYNQLSGKK